jgi:predicted double-glycine peptidase
MYDTQLRSSCTMWKYLQISHLGRLRSQLVNGLGMILTGTFLILSAVPQSDAAEKRVVKSLLEMRRENVIVQTYDLSCGAAALATLLTYQHGDPVTEKEITEQLIRDPRYLADPLIVRKNQGFSLLDLKRFVERRGYEGLGYGQLELENLIEMAPVLVPIHTNGYNHFVIFRGIIGNRVALADPAFGNRTMPIEVFKTAWLSAPEFGKVGFMVKRRDGASPPNRLKPQVSDLTALPSILLRNIITSPISR